MIFTYAQFSKNVNIEHAQVDRKTLRSIESQQGAMMDARKLKIFAACVCSLLCLTKLTGSMTINKIITILYYNITLLYT